MKKLKKTLITSVGGSTVPVAEAINSHRPDFVFFIASDKSEPYISEIDNSILDLTIPSIKCRMEHKTFVVSNPDDIDVCFEETKRAYDEATKFSEKIIFDYSGGTKTMSVAVALVAINTSSEMTFVSGARKDVVRVLNGTEFIKSNKPWFFHYQKKLEETKKLFNIGLYQSAIISSLEILPEVSLPEFKIEFEKICKLSKCFNAWDKFNHEDARKILSEFSHEYKDYLLRLNRIIGEKDSTGYEQVVDLICNAKRKAKLGMYDDAIARLYRTLEMLIQVRLKKEYGIDTSDINMENENLNEEAKQMLIQKYQFQDKKIKVALVGSWELLKIIKPEDIFSKIYNSKKNDLREIIQKRNISILAHGTETLTEKDFERMEQFVCEYVESCLKSINIKVDYYDFPKL